SAMHDVHLVPAPRESIHQPVQVHGVAAEAVRGVEDRKMAKLKRSRHACSRPPEMHPKAAAPIAATKDGSRPPVPPFACCRADRFRYAVEKQLDAIRHDLEAPARSHLRPGA